MFGTPQQVPIVVGSDVELARLNYKFPVSITLTSTKEKTQEFVCILLRQQNVKTLTNSTELFQQV